MRKSREQQLVDICFQIAMTAASDRGLEYFGSGSDKNERICDWVVEQLRECGFPTHQQGSSWGVLDE